jgi:hypothetical protein
MFLAAKINSSWGVVPVAGAAVCVLFCGLRRGRSPAGARLNVLSREACRLFERFEKDADKGDGLDRPGKNDDSHSTKTLAAQLLSVCVVHLGRYAEQARYEAPIPDRNTGAQAFQRATQSIWPSPRETEHPKPLVSISLSRFRT